MRQLLAVLLVGLISSVGMAQEELPGAVEEARVKADGGDVRGAILDLERFLEAPQAPVVARELLGSLYLRAERPKDAFAILQPLTTGSTQDPVVLFNVARALHDLGRTSEGEAYLMRSVQLAPLSRATLQLARLRAASGAFEEVIRLLEPMTEGSVAEAMEREDAALAHEVASSIASAWLELDAPEKALPHLKRVVRLAPSQAPGWERLGKALVDLGLLDEAYKALSRAQLLEERQHTAAIEGAARAERLLSEASELARANRLDEALDLAREAQQAAAWESAAWLLEIRLLIDLRRDDEALRRAERLAARIPTDSEVRFLRGSARLAVRDLSGAEADFRSVLEQAPAHRPAMNSLGLVLMVTDRIEEAKAVLRELLERWPDDPIASKNLDRIERKEGNP